MGLSLFYLSSCKNGGGGMTPDDAVDPHGGEGGVKGGHQVSLSHTATQGLLKLQSYW